MIEERRTRRSDERPKALALFLESSREKLRVHALTVSTSEGGLVAGSGEGALLLAALAAKIDAGEDPPHRVQAPVATWRFRVGDATYVLASLGASLDAFVGDGVRRILS